MNIHQLICQRFAELKLRSGIPDQPTVAGWMKLLDADGRFNDLNYTDRSPSAWEPGMHVTRLAAMARAYVHPTGAMYHSEPLLEAIQNGLEHWLINRYQCPNWWHNRIGVPLNMQIVAVLLQFVLTKQQLEGALQILDQAGPVEMSAANLLWVADIVIHRAALRGRDDELRSALQRVWQEVTVGAGEGIQADGSYYQHGHRLQSHHYGGSFAATITELAWQVRETPFAIPVVKREIISNYIANGLAWMSRGAYITPATIDRAVSRPKALRDNQSSMLESWMQVVPSSRRRPLERTRGIMRKPETTPSGCRYFPYGDLMVIRNNKWSFYLKTISKQTELTESINGENLKGVPYLNCGNHWLLKTGQEYLDTVPLWNWSQLPGLSSSSEESTPVKPPRVAGLSDGAQGLVCMPFIRKQGDAKWALLKSWFLTQKGVVCLITPGDTDRSSAPMITSLEQCRAQGDVLVSTDGEVRKLKVGQHLDHCDWVWHSGVLYASYQAGQLGVRLDHRKGNWHDINTGLHAGCEADMLEVWLSHAGDQACATAIWPDQPAPRTAGKSSIPSVEVLVNDHHVQAAKIAALATMTVFHEASELELPKGAISVDTACVMMLVGRKLNVAGWSDHKAGTVGLTVNGKRYTATLSEYLEAKPAVISL
ncbi:MAG: polysaccharide lyase family 8 super-sandwich domain-containing protein [Armatimonadota bacterium]